MGNGLKSLVFAGFLPDFAIPPFFGVCINTFVGLYTRLFGEGGGFAVQVIKMGEGFCVFLIGEEILEDPKLQLTELNN